MSAISPRIVGTASGQASEPEREEGGQRLRGNSTGVQRCCPYNKQHGSMQHQMTIYVWHLELEYQQPYRFVQHLFILLPEGF